MNVDEPVSDEMLMKILDDISRRDFVVSEVTLNYETLKQIFEIKYKYFKPDFDTYKEIGYAIKSSLDKVKVYSNSYKTINCIKEILRGE